MTFSEQQQCVHGRIEGQCPHCDDSTIEIVRRLKETIRIHDYKGNQGGIILSRRDIRDLSFLIEANDPPQ